MKKYMKIITAFLFMIPLVVSCGPTSTEPTTPPVVEANDIQFKASGYTEGKDFKILRGEEVTIQATVYPKNATTRTVTWDSSNADIELTDIGDNKAVIKGWDVGKSDITVTVGSYKEVLEVECVTEIMPKSISVPKETVQLRDNTRMEVSVKVLPDDTTNPGINVSVKPVETEVENNNNGITTIIQEDFFYVKELQADIGDIYRVDIVSQRDPSVKASFNVEIIPYEVEEVSFKVENPTVSIYDPTFRMTPDFEPELTTYLKVDFSSMNPDICDIDPVTGKLFPKKPGQAVIRATSEMSEDVYGETTVTITDEETEYIIRGLKKSDIDELPVSTITYHDMEFNKTAFAEWKSRTSEDTWYSHALDGGWAKWIVGQDYIDDNDQPDDDRMNTLVFNKVMVPEDANIAQFVFRSHLHPEDTSNVRLLMIDEEYNVTDLTNGWIEFDQTYDKFYNVDVTELRGKAITWVIEQDQVNDIFAEDVCCGGQHLQFRNFRFDVDDNVITEDPFYELKDIHESEA